jgi:MFS family permease
MKEESKATKKGRILKITLQLLLLVIVLTVLYFQLQSFRWNEFAKITVSNWWFLILSFVLIPVNQWFEYVKWQKFTNHLVHDRSLVRKAFLAGLASGFLSPNGWGNVFGRMIYFRKRDRMLIVLSTALGNLSQLLPTVFFGAIAFSMSGKYHVSFTILSWILFAGLVLLYFFADRLFKNRKWRVKWIRHLLLMLQRFGYLRFELLALSTLRFLVFSAQFVLLFMAFGCNNISELTLFVWLIYAFTSFVPSLWSGKILIRETAALFVLTGSGIEPSVTIVVCLLIWIFNIAMPALFGSFVRIPLKQKLK